MTILPYAQEAFRILKRNLYVRKKGFKKYSGSAEEICRKITEDCWNGKYFQVSTGHFQEFFIRDFGWCVDSLLKLGYKEEVIMTLKYALKIYSEQGLKTTISPSGKAFDIFTYSPDSLAYLIRSLRAAKAYNLIKVYKKFIEIETKKFYSKVIDKKTGLVKKNVYFSSMRDQAKRRSSCYDNIMAAMLSDELNKLKLYNPMKKIDFKKLIKENFWTGKYFLDDVSGSKVITGDSNTIPFWTGVFEDRKMLRSAVNEIQKQKLDMPFPLKYCASKKSSDKMIFMEKFIAGYERNTCWLHIGPIYVQIVKKINPKKAREYKLRYKRIIERYKNFIEVFNADSKPYSCKWYYADEGMLWAANYLIL